MSNPFKDLLEEDQTPEFFEHINNDTVNEMRSLLEKLRQIGAINFPDDPEFEEVDYEEDEDENV